MKTVSFTLMALLLVANPAFAAGNPPPVGVPPEPVMEKPVIKIAAPEQPRPQELPTLRPLPPSQEASAVAEAMADKTARHAGQADAISLKVYKVHYADVAQVAEVIPMMLPSTNGLVLEAVDRKLVVRGTAEQHAVVRDLLRDLDAPPKNIQVNVQFGTSGQSVDREIGIRPQDPIVINQDGVHGALQGRFSNQSTTTRENTGQMLVAADGRSASLRVGETVPYIAWLTEYGHRHGYVRDIGIEWRDVGSFLSMEPTILGNGLIRIRLTPEVSGRSKDGTRQSIQFTHLATEVVARDGQTVSIGGFNTDKDFSSKFFIGSSGSGETSFTDITLTPHILD